MFRRTKNPRPDYNIFNLKYFSNLNFENFSLDSRIALDVSPEETCIQKTITVDSEKKRLDDLVRLEEESIGIYRVEKIVSIKHNSKNQWKDLFEVIWEGYPGQNTWQTREDLWSARYKVAIFEHPELFESDNETLSSEIDFYGSGKRQSVKKRVKFFKFK